MLVEEMNGDTYLVWSTVLEAALDEKITETIDHERVCLRDDSLYDLVFLICSANLEFL